MLLLEYWKDIPGFKSYQASYSGKLRHLGKVVERGRYRFDWQPGRILRTHDSKGYVGIKLAIDGKRYHKSVHVLVACTFLPNPDNLPEVNHLNFNRSDNQVSNLEWVTRAQNKEHAIRHGRGGGRKKKSPAQLSARDNP